MYAKKVHKDLNYCQALQKVGAMPILIPILPDFVEDIPILLKKIDGVIISGGVDVHPYHYGEEPIQGLGMVTPNRDIIELAISKECVKNKIPLFGICRGMQVLNIALGGDVYQDIYKQIRGRELLQHNQSSEGEHANHSIDIEAESFLYEIFQQKIGWVNSFHHQVIKNIAPSLKDVAWSKDGFIEAVEHKDIPSIFAVQWHPEKMWDRDIFSLKLFKYFVDFLK